MPKRIDNVASSPMRPETLEPATAESPDQGDAKTRVAPSGSESGALEKMLDLAAQSQDAPVSSESAEPSTAKEETPPADTEAAVEPTSSESSRLSTDKKEIHVAGIPEWVRTKGGHSTKWEVQYLVDPETAVDVQEMVEQAERRERVQNERVVPTSAESFGTTAGLFARIKQTFSEQTQCDDRDCALLTYWALSTWFQEVLSFAPYLAITGLGYEGATVLRALRAVSRNGILVRGLRSANLDRFYHEDSPTLLIFEPNLCMGMASLLACTTRKGFYCESKKPNYFDYFGSKAVFVGEDMRMKSMLQHSLQINASPTPGRESNYAPPLSREMAQNIQNQLLAYRVATLLPAYQSKFSVTGLTPEMNAIATVLGSCILDAPDLRAELVSLLAPRSDQQMAERVDELEMLTIDAALDFCHRGMTEILVRTLAAEINLTLATRGDRLRLSPEKVGHKLKKIGLLTRRLSSAGNGLVLDHPTQVLLHQVAKAYGCGSLAPDQASMCCSLCMQNKAIAEAV
jgi:hypothetical protein